LAIWRAKRIFTLLQASVRKPNINPRARHHPDTTSESR
jgi:hypothetical protein